MFFKYHVALFRRKVQARKQIWKQFQWVFGLLPIFSSDYMRTSDTPWSIRSSAGECTKPSDAIAINITDYFDRKKCQSPYLDNFPCDKIRILDNYACCSLNLLLTSCRLHLWFDFEQCGPRFGNCQIFKFACHKRRTSSKWNYQYFKCVWVDSVIGVVEQWKMRIFFSQRLIVIIELIYNGKSIWKPSSFCGAIRPRHLRRFLYPAQDIPLRDWYELLSIRCEAILEVIWPWPLPTNESTSLATSTSMSQL